MSVEEKLEERKFLLECIKLYENLPALWNMKCKDYSNREKKNQQYEILLSKYRQRYLKADKTELKKKFNSLRTNFRKELKKMGDSQSGIHSDEPTLWYFDQMKFLLNIDGLNSSQNGMSDDGELYEQEPQLQASIRNLVQHPSIHAYEIEPKPKKKKSNSSTDELVRLATLRLKSTQGSYHQIANVWANKLSKMDRNQRIIAEKIINDVMFNGELGLLNYDSTLTNIGSVCSLNPPSSLISNTTNTNETSAQSRITNSYNTNDINPQRFSEDHIKYPSPSLLISSDVITGHESDQMEDNFIVAEYDPLANSIKTED